MKYVVVLCLLAYFRGATQTPLYLIYTVRGDATVQKVNAKPQKAAQKLGLFQNDVLTLVKNAEVTLITRNGQYLVLATAGLYKISELAKRLHVSVSGNTKNYLSIFWNDVLSPGQALKKANRMGGLATRGQECNNLIFPVNGLKTSRDTLEFVWRQSSSVPSYFLYVLGANGDTLVRQPVKDTQYVLPVSRIQGNKGGKYYWKVVAELPACEDEVPPYFELTRADEEQRLILALLPAGESGDILGELNAIEKLEKNAFVYAAADRLRALLKSHPDDTALLKNYVLFLSRYGMDKKAEAAWVENRR